MKDELKSMAQNCV